jgi:hypothetical protein
MHASKSAAVQRTANVAEPRGLGDAAWRKRSETTPSFTPCSQQQTVTRTWTRAMLSRQPQNHGTLWCWGRWPCFEVARARRVCVRVVRALEGIRAG